MNRSIQFLKRSLVSVAKNTVRRFGYELVSDSARHMTMDGGLARLKERGIAVETVIDVGASNGRWSELCMKHYPNAAYHLIEAQTEYEQSLARLRSAHARLDFTLAVASDGTGEIFFDDHVVGGGTADKTRRDGNFKVFPATTIDNDVKRRALNGPFLIKLDTHGFEVAILTGAASTLARATAVIIECYNFRLNESSLRFQEMVDFMEERGFRCIDIVDLSLRPGDSVLWQMDIFFTRADYGGFRRESYE